MAKKTKGAAEPKAQPPSAESEAYLKLPVEDCIPNDWNPNVVDKEMMKKLKAGVQKLYEANGRIPPIIVRPHPLKTGKYQIIDGFHRWTVTRELKHDGVDAFVINVDDGQARILTSTLNYLRGTPDEQKYGDLIADLVKGGMKVKEIAALMPEGEDEILDLIDRSESAMDIYKLLDDQDEEDDERSGKKELSEEETWVEVKFTVSVTQARIIEKEIDRIESLLKGKNRRGRALEYMAVLSSQTPKNSIEGLMEDSDEDGRDEVVAAKKALSDRKKAAEKGMSGVRIKGVKA